MAEKKTDAKQPWLGWDEAEAKKELAPWDTKPDDPDKTPVLCLACGGNWQRTVSDGHGKHATIACRWCVQGAMSERGAKRWREYRERRKVKK